MRDDFVRVTVVENELAAELACSALRADGIECMHRQTNFGAGAFDGMPGGAQEVFVRPQDLPRAREILADAD
jgi:Putative prokaryotic signal transducing protein